MRYLLDTNICIYAIKRHPLALFQYLETFPTGDIAVSAITCCELQFRIAKSSKPAQSRVNLELFLAPLKVLSFPPQASEEFGKLRAHLNGLGTPIGTYDLLLASHALHEGLTIVTNNEIEFQRVPDLQIENWAERFS